ncbi:hypothetical protein E2C01_076103 [Portunus trituberculatus]|uniref:Uncharacterized protein n=1 Tax=Portunus trituberculatus TaxID=210409 RepID=A0A5B7IHH0_PORTR|nr:hypothetical protein [Portunus trituberculatus]
MDRREGKQQHSLGEQEGSVVFFFSAVRTFLRHASRSQWHHLTREQYDEKEGKLAEEEAIQVKGKTVTMVLKKEKS